jgi:hypothetical protein
VPDLLSRAVAQAGGSVTAPDDLARLIAQHRLEFENSGDCGCGVYFDSYGEWERHLASVVSRRDADLQAQAWDEGHACGVADGQSWRPRIIVNPYPRPPADTDTGRGHCEGDNHA